MPLLKGEGDRFSGGEVNLPNKPQKQKKTAAEENPQQSGESDNIFHKNKHCVAES